MQWSTELEQTQWWVDGLRPFEDHCVGSTVPSGFEAVARLFHPIKLDTGETETWASLAERNGRVVHPEMQPHAINTPKGWPIRTEQAGHSMERLCWVGDLPKAETRHLAKLVAGHTQAPDDCWFGVWDGYGMLHRESTLRRLRLGLPTRKAPGPGVLPKYVDEAGSTGPRSRRYFLLNGALTEMDDARSILGDQTPNLWWPADRSWFVASEIDFGWTLIGGSQKLIDELVASDQLEVLESGYGHRGLVDSDTINV